MICGAGILEGWESQEMWEVTSRSHALQLRTLVSSIRNIILLWMKNILLWKFEKGNERTRFASLRGHHESHDGLLTQCHDGLLTQC